MRNLPCLIVTSGPSLPPKVNRDNATELIWFLPISLRHLELVAMEPPAKCGGSHGTGRSRSR